MKKLLVSTSIALALLVAFVSLASAATGGITDAQALKDLAAVRLATFKYHDVNQALADGFTPTETCVAVPGVGGMGYHYVNIDRVIDPAIELTKPEILLYARVDGEMKLVGVEYMLAIGAPDTQVPNPAPPAPVLFGQSFDGPMEGHEPGMPPHYDFHVWVWQANPDGMFAPLNPLVSCQ